MEIYMCLIEEFGWDGNYTYNQTYHTSKANAWKWGKKKWLEWYELEFNRYKTTWWSYIYIWKFESNRKFTVRKIEITD